MAADSPHADPRFALVTGATSGIGRALSQELAAAGLAVGLVARNAERGEETRRAIVEATGNDRVEVFVGDLSSLADVRALAAAVAQADGSIDLLVHCAAVYTSHRAVTADGLETMYATNVLGPFRLTELLRPGLEASDAARVLVLSAPSTVTLDFDDLQAEHRFRSLTAFGATKAAGLLFTFELARRLDGSAVTANAVHPGLSRTDLMRQAPLPLRWATWLVSKSPRRVARDILPLALSPAYRAITGRFFLRGREIEAPAYTRDPEVARRLWEVNERLAGTPPPG